MKKCNIVVVIITLVLLLLIIIMIIIILDHSGSTGVRTDGCPHFNLGSKLGVRSAGLAAAIPPKKRDRIHLVTMPTLITFDVIEFCPICHRPYHELVVYINHETHIVLIMFEHGWRLCARSPNRPVGVL